ncbi:hypothetical protein D3C78_1692920 [compost metagenome]
MQATQVIFRVAIRVTINLVVTAWAQEHEVGGIVRMRFSVMICSATRAFGAGRQDMRHLAPLHWLASSIVERKIHAA